MNHATRPYQVAAYFPEWGIREGYAIKNLISSGSAEKITIINYAFGIPGQDAKTGDIISTVDDPQAAYAQVYDAEMSVDGQADDPSQSLRGHFNQIRKLKVQYPHIKVIISLGGWTGSGWFSDACRTPEVCERFVRSCIDLYVKGNLPVVDGAGGEGAGAGVFDGIDIDWEYPVRGGLPENHYDPGDAANFVMMLKEFRRQYAIAGRPDFLLTMAAPGPAQAAQYNMDQAHELLDYVALMAYDFRGAWSPITGHHTNLCGSEYDPAPPAERVSGDRTVRVYRDTYGVPAEKLLLGCAFYGRAWQEVTGENNGLYQPGKGVSGGGSEFYNLKIRIAAGCPRFWDASACAPYLYDPVERTFWTYEDQQSLALKAQYVKHHQLGGIMFWEISEDDSQGSLVQAIHDTLEGASPSADPCRNE